MGSQSQTWLSDWTENSNATSYTQNFSLPLLPSVCPVPTLILPHFCCCLVTKLSLTLCNPMDCSVPGFPVLNYLLKFAQTHVHWVGDAIQPSHPLSSPSPPIDNYFYYLLLDFLDLLPGNFPANINRSILPLFPPLV